jgi:hypothetical protein
MAKTLAQMQADKQLEEAVRRTIHAYKLLPPGHNMIEHLTIIEGMAISEEDDDGVMPESIAIAFRNGVVRTSVAKGLVAMASEALTSDYAREEN